MANEKACKLCKRIIDTGDSCTVCNEKSLTTNWKGFVIIFDAPNSDIAKRLEIDTPGKYALRLSK